MFQVELQKKLSQQLQILISIYQLRGQSYKILLSILI